MYRITVNTGARGTWLQSEEACYPSGGQLRHGAAIFPDGKRRAVRAGVADTMYTIPAHARVNGKYTAGHVMWETPDGFDTTPGGWYAFIPHVR